MTSSHVVAGSSPPAPARRLLGPRTLGTARGSGGGMGGTATGTPLGATSPATLDPLSAEARRTSCSRAAASSAASPRGFQTRGIPRPCLGPPEPFGGGTGAHLPAIAFKLPCGRGGSSGSVRPKGPILGLTALKAVFEAEKHAGRHVRELREAFRASKRAGEKGRGL